MKLLLRALLALLLAGFGVLLVEGVLSFALGRSLRAWLPSDAEPSLGPLDARAAAARLTSGPYRVPDDPLVSYTLKAEADLTYREGQVAMPLVTDALGMRPHRRPVPDGAYRIVVLGDSVAFGFGLDEGGTLAEQLEERLNALAPERPVACFTVAVPSWNVTNAFRFLKDHLGQLHPDLVLWMPVANDLEDGYGVDEAGARRVDEDPSSRTPFLHVRPEWAFLSARARELGARGETPSEHPGVEVLVAGLTALSRERYADAARTVGAAQERLARAGARLALAFHEQGDFQRELRAALLRAGLALDELALYEGLERADTLGIDPHPSAATAGVMASWAAEELVRRGWIRTARPATLEELPEAVRARRAVLPDRAAALAWSEAFHARQHAALEARLDPRTLQGMLQVYGGINLDDSLEPWFAAALRGGRELELSLAPLAGQPTLYPLEVEVYLQGARAGTLLVDGSGVSSARFALEVAEAPVEVLLVARDHTLVTMRGKSWTACARLVALEVRP
ncbi:MAG: SGNH/GDSL hydrolase family protein [Planctomycetota bacterium]